MTDTILRPGQAARMLGTTADTLKEWALKGMIPAMILPSGQHRYRLEDVQAITRTVLEASPKIVVTFPDGSQLSGTIAEVKEALQARHDAS